MSIKNHQGEIVSRTIQPEISDVPRVGKGNVTTCTIHCTTSIKIKIRSSSREKGIGTYESV